MSDPENIFAQQVSDDYMALERQGKSGQQGPYSQQEADTVSKSRMVSRVLTVKRATASRSRMLSRAPTVRRDTASPCMVSPCMRRQPTTSTNRFAPAQ